MIPIHDCPRCGNKPGKFLALFGYEGEYGSSLYQVCCHGCHDCGPLGSSDDEGIELWNKQCEEIIKARGLIQDCPLCGEQAIVFRGIADIHSIKCEGCSISGPTASTEQEAIKAWNSLKAVSK